MHHVVTLFMQRTCILSMACIVFFLNLLSTVHCKKCLIKNAKSKKTKKTHTHAVHTTQLEDWLFEYNIKNQGSVFTYILYTVSSLNMYVVPYYVVPSMCCKGERFIPVGYWEETV